MKPFGTTLSISTIVICIMLRVSFALRSIARSQPRFQPLVQPKFVFSARNFSTEETKSSESTTANANNGEAAKPDEAPVDPTIALHAEIKDLKERVLRSLAEVQNVRRIAERDVENANAYANTSFAKAMLEVADDLERAIGLVPADKRNSSEDPTLKVVLQGIEMTDKKLHKKLNKFGIVKFGKVVEPFDLHHHDALFQIPDAAKPGTIGNVVKSGYKLKDRVIRAAQVGGSAGGGGIPNLAHTEKSVGSNGVGIPNSLHTEKSVGSDGGGIPNSSHTEKSVDTEGGEIPNTIHFINTASIISFASLFRRNITRIRNIIDPTLTNQCLFLSHR